MRLKKGSGILLHVTSLPGIYGIGDLGPQAYKFIDFLCAGLQKYWQILPLNPPGPGESPYQAFSAFAGNPLLISPDKLIQEELLNNGDLQDLPLYNKNKVEFPKVKNYKDKLFRIAFQRFNPDRCPAFTDFVEQNCFWLENYSLFMSLKKYFNGCSRHRWESSAVQGTEEAVACYQELLQDEIQYQKFLQFKFFAQWRELKEYANSQNIKIIGDIPIFVADDSADVWANPHLFCLDKQGAPAKIAGVPPDYFSKTGQLWGNPHYNWNRMQQDEYQWWRQRFSVALSLVDLVRLDHFRGFEAYWEIPATEETAVNGRWIKGPGASFFSALEKYLGKLPVIAEDLGIITPEVEQLKNEFDFPGMKILQFILEDTNQKIALPLKLATNSVVYTGTHDNDTILGWFKRHCLEKTPVQKRFAADLGILPAMDDQEISWRFIEIALASSSLLTIIPLQDILALDSSARMNYPGTLGNNWDWRFNDGCLDKNLAQKLTQLIKKYNR
ncbi:MAG: 4-alpha-glucanotransferase [Peptococcaceae bacterium]